MRCMAEAPRHVPLSACHTMASSPAVCCLERTISNGRALFTTITTHSSRHQNHRHATLTYGTREGSAGACNAGRVRRGSCFHVSLEGCKHALGIYSNEACCVWRAFEMQCRFTHSQMQSTMASNAPAELEKVPLKHGIHVELKAAPV